ncbi:MAG: type II secretion system F family protein [Rickettsiales bacterium]|nr:type II secretion system F family protein [Rickettsiales bacterium]
MDLNQDYLTYALGVVIIFTIYMAVAHAFKRDHLKARIKATTAVEDLEEKTYSQFFVFCQGALSLFNILPKDNKTYVNQLSQAGLTSPNAIIYFLFFKRLVQPICFLIGIYFMFKPIFDDMGGWDAIGVLLIAIIFSITGVSGSSLFIDYQRRKYHETLSRSTPEAMDLMLICIESGLGLDAALTRVCQEMRFTHPALVQELDRTRIELNVMSDRVLALQNLADRTGVPGIKSMVAALVQAEKFGTSLADTLRVLTEDQRDIRMFSLEQKAARIPVLITLPLVLCILPSLFIVIIGPAALSVSQKGGIAVILGGTPNR